MSALPLHSMKFAAGFMMPYAQWFGAWGRHDEGGDSHRDGLLVKNLAPASRVQ